MTDEELWEYCLSHCRTERGLFSKQMIARCFRLAGEEEKAKWCEEDPDGFVAVRSESFFKELQERSEQLHAQEGVDIVSSVEFPQIKGECTADTMDKLITAFKSGRDFRTQYANAEYDFIAVDNPNCMLDNDEDPYLVTTVTEFLRALQKTFSGSQSTTVASKE